MKVVGALCVIALVLAVTTAEAKCGDGACDFVEILCELDDCLPYWGGGVHVQRAAAFAVLLP